MPEPSTTSRSERRPSRFPLICRWAGTRSMRGSGKTAMPDQEKGRELELRRVLFRSLTDARTVDAQPIGEATFEIPADLPLGWHTVNARIGEDSYACPLVVSLAAMVLPAALAPQRAW